MLQSRSTFRSIDFWLRLLILKRELTEFNRRFDLRPGNSRWRFHANFIKKRTGLVSRRDEHNASRFFLSCFALFFLCVSRVISASITKNHDAPAMADAGTRAREESREMRLGQVKSLIKSTLPRPRHPAKERTPAPPEASILWLLLIIVPVASVSFNWFHAYF